MIINGYSAAQVRAAEAPHLAAGEPLMQLAAAGLAEEIRRLLPDRHPRVLLLAGSGDNGGDALFAGAALASAGVDVAIITTGERVHEPGLAAAFASGARRADSDQAGKLASEVDVIVDGILGTGTSANPALRGQARLVVAGILQALHSGAKPTIVAVDIPSGINPDDGTVPDSTVLSADVTVTFGAVKAGLLLGSGSVVAGRVLLIDIGLGRELAEMEPLVVIHR